MKFCRCLWALLAVSLVLLVVSESRAFGPRRSGVVPSPDYGFADFYPPPGYPPILQYGYPFNTPYPPGMPYVAPYPYYGILPPPYATLQRLNREDPYYGRRTTGEYNATDTLPYEPRKRPTAYPAVPFGPSPAEQQVDSSRARFEITGADGRRGRAVRRREDDADGVARIFVTPALVEGKNYSSTFEVSWKDEAGTSILRKKTFDFVAGQKVSHTFGE